MEGEKKGRKEGRKEKKKMEPVPRNFNNEEGCSF